MSPDCEQVGGRYDRPPLDDLLRSGPNGPIFVDEPVRLPSTEANDAVDRLACNLEEAVRDWVLLGHRRPTQLKPAP